MRENRGGAQSGATAQGQVVGAWVELSMDKCLVVGKCAQIVNYFGLTGIRQVSGEEDFVFLGIPVGGTGFMKDHIYAFAGRMRLPLPKLGQLDSSRAKFSILRASFEAELTISCGRCHLQLEGLCLGT